MAQATLLTIRQAAELLQVPTETLRRWRCEGRGTEWIVIPGTAKIRDIHEVVEAAE